MGMSQEPTSKGSLLSECAWKSAQVSHRAIVNQNLKTFFFFFSENDYKEKYCYGCEKRKQPTTVKVKFFSAQLREKQINQIETPSQMKSI